MGNKVICIGRQFGSGGHDIGVQTADRLGLRIYEKNLVGLACKFGELSESALEGDDEKATNPYLFKTIYEGNQHVARGLPTTEVLFALQSHEIKRIAKRESCVIVGRCADHVLRDSDASLLRVFIGAPFDLRVRRKMEQERLSLGAATRLVKRMDKQRSRYYRSFTGRDWGDSSNYDLIIDTSVTPLKQAVDIIAWSYGRLEDGADEAK